MDVPAPALKRLVERALARDGELPLAMLLEHLAPVAGLRALAQEFGVTPKGGFRIERAPARVLAACLAERRDARDLERVLQLLFAAADAPDRSAGDADRQHERVDELQALLGLRDGELRQARDELGRARDGASRARDRVDELQRQLDHAAEQLAVLRREGELRDVSSRDGAASAPRDDRELLRRLHELESERTGLLAADAALRRQLALDRSRMRELEDEVAELESLIPRSRRRKKKPLPPAPEQERRFLVPYFQPSFYKSLEGKERRSVERALHAVLLFCTEGHAYPGLEVKQLGGQDMWSLRASLGLRVYFRNRPGGGDIDVLELGDREDQHTTLRRLKDR